MNKKKIAIISTNKLQFPPTSKGVVMMDVSLIQILPEEGKYELTIVDKCLEVEDITIQKPIYKEDPETKEQVIVEYETETIQQVKELARQTRPGRIFTYEQLDQLSKLLQINKNDFESETEYITEMFKQGLLAVTQKECVEGIVGKGLGMYFSKVNQWKIYRGEDLIDFIKKAK